MSLGGFIHRVETADFVWSTKDFCIIRATIGFAHDPNFTANWTKAGQIRKLIYCSPEVSDKVSVYDNASKLVEAIQNLQSWYGQAWKDNPIVVNITHPLIDFMWVHTFASYIVDEGLLFKKILLYTTKKKWDSILIDTADGEVKLATLLNIAEPFVSDYVNSQPELPKRVGKVHYREYSPGKVEYSESGIFLVPGYLFGGTSTEPTPTTMIEYISCPNCGYRHFKIS